MGPVRQNPIQRTASLFICVCIALCTIVAHNIAQNRPDSFPHYPPDNHHCSDDVYLREGGETYCGLRYANGIAVVTSANNCAVVAEVCYPSLHCLATTVKLPRHCNHNRVYIPSTSRRRRSQVSQQSVAIFGS